ncbi:hypothetical protein ACFWA9_10080 [Kitasatospora sp. NPDC059973]|uniref:hypothetical protein n=1 Tax=Kitasatospora sp. NPDC059973 TaxID=3347020 RepID=UPI003674EBAA
MPDPDVTLHQLIGRIVYFHALFVEPAAVPAGESIDGERCCNHLPERPGPTSAVVLVETAWTALDELSATLPGRARRCPVNDASCCATCRVADAGAAIADVWFDTEHRTYHGGPAGEADRLACRRAFSASLSRAFAEQHAAPCPSTLTAAGGPLPRADDFPLTGELLTVWDDPLSTTGAPVVSWLNHCTGLDDVLRVLETRKGTA